MSKPGRNKQRIEQDPKAPKEDEVFKKGTPPDVTSVRAKSTVHRKVTADKWNQ
ncbi:MAG: hypothetical protein M3265_07080 [Actinomycetota bacterium]|nr:hypothetical protein [Actinomycetota bacterium]